MSFRHYVKEKLVYLMINALLWAFIFLTMHVVKAPIELIIMLLGLMIIACFAMLLEGFYKHKKYYDEVFKVMEQLEEIHYLSEIISLPEFEEGRVFYEILKRVSEDCVNQIIESRQAVTDYQEYIETWIHEIKRPIAGIDLICQNNQSDLTREIASELSKVDNHVEKALYYARSTQLKDDYYIQEHVLDTLIKNAVKKRSKALISAKTTLSIESLDYQVFCDKKWVDFMLGQIIDNSIKYAKGPLQLTFSGVEKKGKVILEIKDNGIGIPKQDLNRVFNKGFTGINGRLYTKSTGIGLYLCQKLCQKMYMGIRIDSKEGEYTIVQLIFPVNQEVIMKQM